MRTYLYDLLPTGSPCCGWDILPQPHAVSEEWGEQGIALREPTPLPVPQWQHCMLMLLMAAAAAAVVQVKRVESPTR